MTNTQKSLPIWILILSGLLAIMEFFAAISLCFFPESMQETIDLQAKGMIFVLQMWGCRQFALGFIFAFATFKKSIPMLMLAYIFLLVMFLGDLLIGISKNEMSFVISAVVLCALASLMLFVLNKAKKTVN